MRPALAVLALLLLPGCFDYTHGCREDGRHAIWTDDGAWQRALDAGWTVRDVDSNLSNASAAPLGGEAQWWRLTRNWNDDESIRYSPERGLAGIVSQQRSDGDVAAMIEAFVQDHFGRTINGHDYLDDRPGRGDPYRLIGGQFDAPLDADSFVARDGAWVGGGPGHWTYRSGLDALSVRVPTATGPYSSDAGALMADAGNRVRGPYVDGDDAMAKDAARNAWAVLGWPEPTFEDYEADVSMICT